MNMHSTTDKLDFFATPEHECSYLPDRRATTLFADPRYPKDTRVYSILSRNGFRRSGEHIYRPHCAQCQACIPIRVAVNEFQPSRSQRRAWRTNNDLYTVAREPRLVEEHFELYRTYLNHRHRGGGMDNPTKEQYMGFLNSTWSDTVFYEFRMRSTLMAVAVMDHLDDGSSAVYTFFDPRSPARSLGVYTVLWQLHEVKRRGGEWLYLGYLIHASTKMNYKSAYRPQQHHIGGQWQSQ